MIIELNNIIIDSKVKLSYLDDIVKYIRDNEKRILDFFNIDKLSQKYKIIIMPFNEFRDYIINKYGKYENFQRGDTDKSSNTIRILSFEDQKEYTTHKDEDFNSYLKMILHEFVHACNDEINNDYYETTWFNEGLATNLANQNYNVIDLSDCDFNRLKKEWNNYGKNKYSYAFTIVNYIINNYSKEELDKLISDSNYLREKSNEIFNNIKNK